MCSSDLHKQNEFNLRALLFVTINGWPAFSNISGQSNKGYNACTHYLGETESIYLENKNVYPGHRRFLPNKLSSVKTRAPGDSTPPWFIRVWDAESFRVRPESTGLQTHTGDTQVRAVNCARNTLLLPV